jgi:phage shock protein PspC (stress-responsive transcriptional regulator)
MEETGVSETLINQLSSHFQSLFRDPENGQILGVCAGLASVYGLNPLPLRIVAVALLLSVPALCAPMYVILAVILPDSPVARQRGGKARHFVAIRDNDPGVIR